MEQTRILPGAARNSTGDHDGAEHPTETTGLLSEVQSVHTTGSAGIPDSVGAVRTVGLLCAIIFTASTAGGFQGLPAARTFEGILCQQYYTSHERTLVSLSLPSEDDCKISAIQSQLVYLFAVNNAATAAVGCLAAMPWGIAADKYGRRFVLAICLYSSALSMAIFILVAWFSDVVPVKLIWTSSLTGLIGGGNAVVMASLSGMLADVLPEAERAVGFMRINVAAMLGHLIAPTVAGALMPVVGSWVLMSLGFLLMIAAAASTGLLPETLRTGDKTTEGREGDESPKADKIWKGGFNQVLSALKDSAGVLQSRSLILLVVTTLLALPASLCTLNLLSLYTSARFHIRLAETGYIQTAFGIAQAIVALVLLPWLSRNTNSARWAPSLQLFGTEVRRDLSLTRLSLAALTLGATVLGLAPSLPYFTAGLAVMALGSAAEGLIMGLMSTYVTADHRARLYTLIGILQVVSACYSDPMLAACYAAGLQLGGVWRGLPYLCVAVFCAVQGVLVGFVRVPRRE
ncbi:major facilitator superfamily domain-containing protein [Microdochium bolleyi]|uniref:Major facilitator superfamily domain-containing protein n=1 Tax=Microdochium bolleyi TaxID=196109 RepID=A0A136IMA2_9PEZI|nr:major facilitator superfamily domain-containing protein [Microdochium bolleyi]